MLKYIVAAIIIIFLVSLVGCFNSNVVLDEVKSYGITSDIKSLDVEINAADFTIVHGDKFSVESNLKNLSVSEENGVLKIVDKTKRAVSYNDAVLKLYIPDDVVFEDVVITTGAGKLTADPMSANTMKLKLGAGQVELECLNANNSIEIKGGAGEISILSGSLNNLSLDLGVGELNMTAALTGENNLKFGVGESNITLIGSKDNYNFDVVNGVGKITIDGKSASDFVSSGSAQSIVEIKGGVGATNISFQ